MIYTSQNNVLALASAVHSSSVASSFVIRIRYVWRMTKTWQHEAAGEPRRKTAISDNDDLERSESRRRYALHPHFLIWIILFYDFVVIINPQLGPKYKDSVILQTLCLYYTALGPACLPCGDQAHQPDRTAPDRDRRPQIALEVQSRATHPDRRLDCCSKKYDQSGVKLY